MEDYSKALKVVRPKWLKKEQAEYQLSLRVQELKELQENYEALQKKIKEL